MKIDILCDKTDKRLRDTVRLVHEVVADMGVRAEINEIEQHATGLKRRELDVVVNGYNVTLPVQELDTAAQPEVDRARYEKIRAAVERFAWQ